jgi:YbbR domain-containing protein
VNAARRRRARRIILARRFFGRTLGVRFLVALVLSTLVWVVWTLEQNPSTQELIDDDIQVDEVNLGPSLVLASPIQPVRVTVGGPRENIGRLTVRDFSARVNLAGIGSGVHQIPVEVAVADAAMDVVRITPETVTVQIDPFEVRAIEVTARLESAPAVGFRAELNDVVSSPASVQVSGGASDVDEVAAITANLSLEGATSDVSTQALLVPTDRSGNEVGNVHLDPQTAQVRVPITRITSRKRVPVLAELAGSVAPGFFVREISVVPTTVEIQGQPEDIERVNAVRTAALSIDGVRGDVEGNVAFDSPVGVRVLSDEPTAAIAVTVEPLADTTTIQAAVVAVNIGPNLSAAVSQPSVQVVVGGSVETLQELRAGDIVAEVDLSNLSAGRHQLRPVITVPPGIDITQVTPPVIAVELQREASVVPLPQTQPLIGPAGAVATATPTPTPTPAPATSPPPIRTSPIS